MRRAAVLLACLLLAVPAHAATVDILIGAVSPNGESGTHNMLAVGLDVPAGGVTVATRLTRMGLDGGYATGLTLAGEWPIYGSVVGIYGTAGAGLSWYEMDESLDIACRKHKGRTSCTGTLDAPDGSALHLQGGFGALIPAGKVGLQVEAVYRLPVHEGTGGIVGTFGIALPLP